MLYFEELINLFQTLYYNEIERINKLNSNIANQLTITAGYVTVLFFLAGNELKDIIKRGDFLSIFFLLFFGSYFICTIICVIRVLLNLYNTTNGKDIYLPYSNYLVKNIGKYSSDNNTIFLSKYINMLATARDMNLKNNNEKERAIRNTTIVIIINAILLFISIALYLVLEQIKNSGQVGS